MHILVVDDDRFNLKVAEGLLMTFYRKAQITLCIDPTQVLGLLKEEAIDIILLDIMMPKITGIELLEIIRSMPEYNHIRIIMLTSLTDEDSFKKCFDLGVNDFLNKPINQTEFNARISAAIETRKNHMALQTLYNQVKDQNDALKAVNGKLKEAQFHLVQSEKLAAIGELAAGVAHEINNPIGYVGSNLETMSRYMNSMVAFINFIEVQINEKLERHPEAGFCDIMDQVIEERKKLKIDYIMNDIEDLISDSKEGVDKIAQIVKSLRNFARTGTDEVIEHYSYEEIINEVLLIVSNEAKYTVEIVTSYEDTQGLFVNRGQYAQVILNIIVNAIQAIKDQGRSELGHIKIHSYDEEMYTCLTITDDGIGMPEDVVNQIFNPFFTTKDVGKGTGLGLSISHDIITTKHKGIIDLKSQFGEGTKFIIKIPRQGTDIK